jgi:hypothetical protein
MRIECSDVDKAVVAPEATSVLVEYDRAVSRDEVVHEVNPTD